MLLRNRAAVGMDIRRQRAHKREREANVSIGLSFGYLTGGSTSAAPCTYETAHVEAVPNFRPRRPLPLAVITSVTSC
jgi:hypothetical protein